MLWLYLLAAVTVLVISLRRVVQRQAPLSDELYSSKVAVEHVHSGVGWVRADGMVGSVNQSLADSIGAKPGELLDRDWYLMFPPPERARVKEAYAAMLLAGISRLDTQIDSDDGSERRVNVRLVAVHDHKMRIVGHHCMIHDESREQSLAQQVRNLSEALAQRTESENRAEREFASIGVLAVPQTGQEKQTRQKKSRTQH
jgi:PAS domain S-box-containing protein